MDTGEGFNIFLSLYLRYRRKANNFFCFHAFQLQLVAVVKKCNSIG